MVMYLGRQFKKCCPELVFLDAVMVRFPEMFGQYLRSVPTRHHEEIT